MNTQDRVYIYIYIYLSGLYIHCHTSDDDRYFIVTSCIIFRVVTLWQPSRETAFLARRIQHYTASYRNCNFSVEFDDFFQITIYITVNSTSLILFFSNAVMKIITMNFSIRSLQDVSIQVLIVALYIAELTRIFLCDSLYLSPINFLYKKINKILRLFIYIKY